MLDSILIGMSGLQGYSIGLKVIANNTANLSTPGFKGSRPQFADQFHAGTQLANGGFSPAQSGGGLNTYPSVIDWKQGELRQTGNELDLAVDGHGLFVLRDDAGQIRYTRAGQFQFNSDDVLVNRIDQSKVMQDASGKLGEISLKGLRNSAAAPTSLIKFSGNLSSTGESHTIGSIPVIDAAGGTRSLTLVATSIVSPATGLIDGNTWSLALDDGAGGSVAAVAAVADVSDATLRFIDGMIDPAGNPIKMKYTPAGQSTVELTLDFGADVTGFASGTISSLAMSSVDGSPSGALTKVSFDSDGAMVLSYSNGNSASGPRLVLGRFESADSIRAVGDNQFEAIGTRPWQSGRAGEGAFGVVRSGVIEISNVDLSGEFGHLVVIQRGYQASSRVITTSDEMLKELFNMGGK